MSKPRILAFAGSTRIASYNKTLVQWAAKSVRDLGGDVTLVDLRDFPLPIFDEDLEKETGAPANAQRLKALFLEHEGLLIASPEYNSSVTAVLKNCIDWISRSAPNEPGLVAFRGKVAALLSASPGALGGLRGLVHLRSILGNIGVLVLPEQFALSRAFEAFDAEGNLKDAKQRETVTAIAERLTNTVAKLKG